ncbi:MAG TPA: TolC family protein [Gemmatimonadaceae bacterium]|nr:TolC family protein [Gemmatimonadaceae bacterium]
MHSFKLVAAGAIAFAAVRGIDAQQAQRVSRAEAVATALARGPRLTIARADSFAARAQLIIARQYENPILGVSFTKSYPQQHYTFDLPLDYPWLRDPRISSARAGLGAATYRYVFERASVEFDTDTVYTRALASSSKARLSQRTAFDADSLFRIARLRRDAGDASELDVQLALVNAGQLANAAAMDSLDAISGLLAVQAAMGLNADVPTIVLADSLEALPAGGPAGQGGQGGGVGAGAGVPLLVAAAEGEAQAAELALRMERRRLFSPMALSLGFEALDPSVQSGGALPTIGFTVPLSLFHRNGGLIAAAQAQRDRTAGLLALARIESYASLSRGRRALALALERARRSEQLLDAANRVASLSLLAYREGASALPLVLESQRTARASRMQYIDDVAAARNAAGLVRLLEMTAPTANRTSP